MTGEDWRSDGRSIGVFFGDRPMFAVLFNAAGHDVEFTLPDNAAVLWHLLLDTAFDERGETPPDGPMTAFTVRAHSTAVFNGFAGVTPRELVADRYTDALGLERIVPAATREAFIAALATAEKTAIAPPTRVLREGDPLTLDVTLPADQWEESLLWTVSDDIGPVKAGTMPLRGAPVLHFVQRGETTVETRRVTLPLSVTASHYRVTLDVRTYGHAGVDIVVAPPRAYLPPGNARIWGLAVQLYTLRSRRNWGIGDFGDLETVCRLAGVARRLAGGHQPAARIAPQRSRSRQPLRADVAPVPELAGHRRRSVARGGRPRRAALHRIGQRRPGRPAGEAVRRLHRRGDGQSAGA